MLNEPQRQAYLEAMGVECYMPRLQLPGAKPSVLCMLPELSAVEAFVDELSIPSALSMVSAGPSSAKMGAAAAQDMLDGSVGTYRKAAKKPAIAGREQASTQAIPSFSLSIITAGPVLLIDEGLAGDVDPQAYLRLIQNMLLALGVSNVQTSFDAFRWPTSRVRNVRVDQSETAACQALVAYLAKQLQQSQGRYVLLMGGTAGKYLRNEGQTSSGLQQHAQLLVPYVTTQSARKAMVQPLIKRTIWQDLAPLVQAIKLS